MKRFFCQCRQEIFFNDLSCGVCGRDLVYDPVAKTMWSGEVRSDFKFYTKTTASAEYMSFRVCQLRESVVKCNWVIGNNEPQSECQCVSCRTTHIIPDMGLDKNPRRWHLLERSKRRMLYNLLDLKLFCGEGRLSDNLRFDFLEDRRSHPSIELELVLTGHNNGLITINAAEADESFLHTMKEQLGERYRTLLGHFRHEIAHYYWCLLIEKPGLQARFREVFGDERQDYAQALEKHYQKMATKRWTFRYITPYASSHPHEDWAETWAHYLHMVDTLETAVSYGLSVYEPKKNDFDHWFKEWAQVSQIMNALNRSMGMADPYPFFLSPIVEGKMRFIDEIVDSAHLFE